MGSTIIFLIACLQKNNLLEIEFQQLNMEFKELRTEIVKRIELRQQVLVITLTIAGVIFGLGVKDNAAGYDNHIVLIYPPIALLIGGQLGDVFEKLVNLEMSNNFGFWGTIAGIFSIIITTYFFMVWYEKKRANLAKITENFLNQNEIEGDVLIG